jgi:hypothetical protein
MSDDEAPDGGFELTFDEAELLQRSGIESPFELPSAEDLVVQQSTGQSGTLGQTVLTGEGASAQESEGAPGAEYLHAGLLQKLETPTAAMTSRLWQFARCAEVCHTVCYV